MPVDIARELDVKLDDGVPDTGVLRLGLDEGSPTVFGSLTQSLSACHTPDLQLYDVGADAQDCLPVFLY